MARVTGIGGFVFRARDPEALNRWYGEQLGVVILDSHGYEDRAGSRTEEHAVRSAPGDPFEPLGYERCEPASEVRPSSTRARSRFQ